MECYYRKNNNRMYRNHSTQMGCRGMRSGSNINDSCMKDEKKSCDKMEKICNFIKEEKNCGCNRTGNMRRENNCECTRMENIRMEKNCGCSRESMRNENSCGCSGMGNTKLESGCGRMGRSGNNCDCNKMEQGCPKKETCGCEKKDCDCKKKENDSDHCCCNREKKDCDKAEDNCYPCEKDEWKNSPVGMGYVPWQCFRMLNDMGDGLESGTIFKELDKPFEVGFCARRCGC